MKDIRAAFFDIDGTLVPFGTEVIFPSARKALEALQEKGIYVYIATGRTLPNFRFAFEQFPFDGFMALNGQYCVHHDQVIRQATLNREDLLAVIPYAQKQQITITFAEKNNTYINFSTEAYRKMHGQKTAGLMKEETADLSRVGENDIYQIMPYIPKEEEAAFFEHTSHLKSVRWHPDFADVIPIDGGKDVGIEAFLKHLGMTREQVIAFGDGGNDIDMLKYAGIGVAMGNASKQVKEAADYVTADDVDDGILKALRHFHIID